MYKSAEGETEEKPNAARLFEIRRTELCEVLRVFKSNPRLEELGGAEGEI